MSKVHEFKKSLRKGKKAENEFYELFKDKVEQLDGYAADFRLKKNQKLLELKTDSYDPSSSPNFFMERFSYGEQNGGPWQALDKGVDYFVYWFPKCNLFYCYKTSALVKKLDELTEGAYMINVQNVAHLTRGYKVERALLAKLELNLEDIL